MSSISFCALLLNFAKHMGYKRSDLINIALGGLLHEVGKMCVAQHLILRQGKVNRKEYAYIKDHVHYSEIILQKLKLDNQLIEDIVLKHYEGIDGSGYPMGLTEKELSQISQMAMIVDLYEALTSERGYKHALESLKHLLIWLQVENTGLIKSWCKHLLRV